MRRATRSPLLALAILACTTAMPASAQTPASPAGAASAEESARSRWGSARLFRASYTPSASPVPLLTLHSWTIHVTDASGAPVSDAELTVVGGMPEHTHGFPTVPEVTALGSGNYRVDGLKFHMPGKWSVIVRIARGADESDSVRFDLDVR